MPACGTSKKIFPPNLSSYLNVVILNPVRFLLTATVKFTDRLFLPVCARPSGGLPLGWNVNERLIHGCRFKGEFPASCTLTPKSHAALTSPQLNHWFLFPRLMFILKASVVHYTGEHSLIHRFWGSLRLLVELYFKNTFKAQHFFFLFLCSQTFT